MRKKKSYLIEGKVLDENNRPMPGVTVLLDSTKVGTATDTVRTLRVTPTAT